MRARFQAIVSGRVQGVAYRYFAQRWAGSLSLSGWVRNLDDGRVELLAEGDKRALEEFLTHLRDGPRLAVVDGIEVRWEPPTGEAGGFRIEF